MTYRYTDYPRPTPDKHLPCSGCGELRDECACWMRRREAATVRAVRKAVERRLDK